MAGYTTGEFLKQSAVIFHHHNTKTTKCPICSTTLEEFKLVSKKMVKLNQWDIRRHCEELWQQVLAEEKGLA